MKKKTTHIDALIQYKQDNNFKKLLSVYESCISGLYQKHALGSEFEDFRQCLMIELFRAAKNSKTDRYMSTYVYKGLLGIALNYNKRRNRQMLVNKERITPVIEDITDIDISTPFIDLTMYHEISTMLIQARIDPNNIGYRNRAKARLLLADYVKI